MTDHRLKLTGLDGGNPLAFLAALGTLRALTRAWPDDCVRMAWTRRAGWRPVLCTAGSRSHDDVCRDLLAQVQTVKDHPTLHLADDLTIPPNDFRRHLVDQVALAHRAFSADPTEYGAAFGCDGIGDDDKIADTALRTMSGAGHQHFLATMRLVLETATAEQLSKAIFEHWRYDDPLEKLSLRFDPRDDKRYALRWDNPSGDPARKKRGNMIGANALAVLGLPLLPTAPRQGKLETTGFRGRRSQDCCWTWPVWECAAPLDVVRSLLAMEELQQPIPPRDRLAAMGIVEVYRSQRMTVNKFRSFAPAQPV